MMRLYRNQKRLFYLTLLVCFVSIICSVYWILFINDDVNIIIYPEQHSTYQLVQKQFQEILAHDKGTGCEMPVLDPFSAEIMRFDETVEAEVCDAEDWVECYYSKCFVKEKLLKQMKGLVCSYKDIIYVTDHYYYLGEATLVNGSDTYVLSRSDQVKVSCTGVDVNRQSLVESRWFGNKAGYRNVMPVRAVTRPENSLNVLMVLLESTSRNHFIRLASKSYKVLIENLQAVVMKSYNIVGDGTSGALWPILTGHEELELADSRKTTINREPVDLRPFIFRLVTDNGYRTAYYEDLPNIGTFSYRFNGFAQSPSDHYLRPFFKEEQKDLALKLRDSCKKQHCVGDKSLMNFMLNYTTQFLDLNGKKLCVTFISAYSHDVNQLSKGDDELADYLDKFKHDGRLYDTVLFVMGDHGPRFSKLRNTYQGKIEERLPFVSIVLPEILQEKRPEALKNLKRNAEVLTTPFDVHTTILDALGLLEHRNTHVVPGAVMERGLSLLKSIPKSRSCGEAGVMPHWCACAYWHNVSASDDLYSLVGGKLTDFINGLTEEKRNECARRTLVSTEWVLRRSPNLNMLGFKSEKQIHRYIGRFSPNTTVRALTEFYQAKIVMSPGDAIYEATMSFTLKDKSFLISEKDISRVNAYTDEPRCLSGTHRHLNKYCYCINKWK